MVHHIIENNIQNYLETITGSLLSRQEQTLALQCCKNYFSSKIYREYIQAEEKHHELSCTYTHEGITLLGRIDLAYCLQGVWTIVDFKTNQPDELYDYQVSIYREILAGALHLPQENIRAAVFYLPENRLGIDLPQNTIGTLATQIKKSGILQTHG